MYRLICISISLIFSIHCKAQVVDKYWQINDVKNTLLELGAKNPSIKDFRTIKKYYIGGDVSFFSNYFLFSKKLKSTDCYSDTVFILGKHQVIKKEDTEVSFRYPGDELSCDSLDNCYVGSSFMKLINLNAPSLIFYDGMGNKPDKFSYKICIINKDRIALLCDNANIILILVKKTNR
jgi:hypothetical protein